MITRRELVLALSATLIVGCAIGLIGGVVFSRWVGSMQGPGGERFHGRPPMHDPVLHMLERRLDLTDEQSARIAEIVARTRARSDTLHDRAHAEIHEILTDDQRARWERMNRRMFRGRGGPRLRGQPPPPPDRP